MNPFIKVCGQTHQSSIDTALSMGVNAVGFIFHPASPRSVTPARVVNFRTGLAKRFGVFVKQDALTIRSYMNLCKLDYAQLHGAYSPEDALSIGVKKVVRVIWPDRYDSLDDLQSHINTWRDYCAYFLVDAGIEGGGHGRTLKSEKLVKKLRFPRPWLLAGGLNATNAAALLHSLRPDGLDLNSGLEMAAGLKSSTKLLDTLRAISN